ncbi:epidermal growth factor receptor-like isoform X2 [Tachypleus tridentatus]|uniref:epidermal growth factor receptor-like isoform X2 n=1 Tax=Tachypleus tridentatus TaxID=6853 RepID=UPI003FD57D8E
MIKSVEKIICLCLINKLVLVHSTTTNFREDTVMNGEKVCTGTESYMSVPSNRQKHYQNIRDRYTNCTHIDGNLELTWLEDENLDLNFLHNIREVTGYVLISHVKLKRVVLPNLTIIRGRNQFKLQEKTVGFALLVSNNNVKTLEMPSLRDILSGSVGFFNNHNLCHIRSIQWDELLSGSNAVFSYVYNLTLEDWNCPTCDQSCVAGCWAEGPQNCQKFSKINCSLQCYKGRCFGPNPRECCHLFCAGGCIGPKQSDCLACRNFNDNGVCKQECPPMMHYNPFTYLWEVNPDGRYAYGDKCVKNCPDHLLRDNGACVRSCLPYKRAVNGECVPCDGPCPKNCKGVSNFVHAGNIDSFHGCTVIEGSLTILDSTFTGFQDIFPNNTFGPLYPEMHPKKLDIFNTLQEITGFVSIQAKHPHFTNLTFLRHLEIIRGRMVTQLSAALYIIKTSLESLNLNSLKKIHSGRVIVLENEDLCFVEDINWERMTSPSSLNTRDNLIENNADKEKCQARGLVCDDKCSEDGCWGPRVNDCLSCKTYRLDDECIENCTVRTGIYYASEKMCNYCHEECDGECFGPGPSNCTQCRNVRDGPYCVAKCPHMKYSHNGGECKLCHQNCLSGCTGPKNTVGPNGCVSCEKAVLSGHNRNVVEYCLKGEEPCPDGYYIEYVSPREEGSLKSLAGKLVCQKCHKLCKTCTSYGVHISMCECINYSSGKQCTAECPKDSYPNHISRHCIKCSNECRGCYGPTVAHCHACRNYRVYFDENQTVFNCTASCPPDKPVRVFVDGMEDPFCSTDDPSAPDVHKIYDDKVQALSGGSIGCTALLVVFLGMFVYFWLKRTRRKENAMKLRMMNGSEEEEPFRLSNIEHNLTKLIIVKEVELTKGEILGYGTFGIVYKGFWVPEGENIKLPVAIRVLREGRGSSTNKEFLEEAYVMAAVNHPNLLKLLAVSVTSQLMLITQFMPFGCLLTYVRNNKDKISSKPLLNWCTQIARAMAYLEEKRLVHRNLALRNVLLQTPGCVKITDYGLAKLLDVNEEEFNKANEKVLIKWLALETIQQRIFSHKSDVWAFGVTVWELLTFGGRPYENITSRDIPDLLDKGGRLPQPNICTIDVYFILIKCWLADAESRPPFKELAEEFGKMAQDPGRYLYVAGDKLSRGLSSTAQDQGTAFTDISMKSDIEGQDFDSNTEDNLIKPSLEIRAKRPDRICRNLEASSSNYRARKNSGRYCSDPLAVLQRDQKETRSTSLKDDIIQLVDEDDYLVPTPQQCSHSAVYVDLNAGTNLSGHEAASLQHYSSCVPEIRVDKLMNQKCDYVNIRETLQKNRDSEEDTDEQDGFTDFDQWRQELQPLNEKRNKTVV